MWACTKKISSRPLDKKFSALCFGMVWVYSQSISKKGIKHKWIPKNMRQFWRISKKLNKSLNCSVRLVCFLHLVNSLPILHHRTTTSFQNWNNSRETNCLRMRKSWKQQCWNGSRWWARSFTRMKWTNCLRITKNVCVETTIMRENEDYRTLKFLGNF